MKSCALQLGWDQVPYRDAEFPREVRERRERWQDLAELNRAHVRSGEVWRAKLGL